MNVHIKDEHMTPAELEGYLGERFRALRLRLGVDQRTLAGSANISLGALRNLERGEGVTLRTMLAALRALNRTDWLEQLAPEPTISPMKMLVAAKPKRQRAFAPRKPRVRS